MPSGKEKCKTSPSGRIVSLVQVSRGPDDMDCSNVNYWDGCQQDGVGLKTKHKYKKIKISELWEDRCSATGRCCFIPPGELPFWGGEGVSTPKLTQHSNVKTDKTNDVSNIFKE